MDKEQKHTIKEYEQNAITQTLTYLPMPVAQKDNASVQLGLFETDDAAQINRVMDYVRSADLDTVHRETARIACIVRTTDRPEHECLVLVMARAKDFEEYVFKLYANVDDLNVSANWMRGAAMVHELNGMGNHLRQFNHNYICEGSKAVAELMGFDKRQKQDEKVMKKQRHTGLRHKGGS